jgi:hypothetical protein
MITSVFSFASKIITSVSIARIPLNCPISRNATVGSRIQQEFTQVFDVLFPHPQIKHTEFNTEQKMRAQETVQQALQSNITKV